jgi:hypothetical protein
MCGSADWAKVTAAASDVINASGGEFHDQGDNVKK